MMATSFWYNAYWKTEPAGRSGGLGAGAGECGIRQRSGADEGDGPECLPGYLGSYEKISRKGRWPGAKDKNAEVLDIGKKSIF